MPVAATGMLSTLLDRLRHTVAGSAAFRTWTGTASEALALPRVHAISADGAATLPLAWVEWTRFRRDLEGHGSQNYWDGDEGNALSVGFRAAIATSDPSDDALTFMNAVGAILAEMEVLAGSGATYLDFASYQITAGPVRDDEEEAASAGSFYELRVEFLVRKAGGP